MLFHTKARLSHPNISLVTLGYAEYAEIGDRGENCYRKENLKDFLRKVLMAQSKYYFTLPRL
jgi:hypothetical protein